MQEAKDIAQCSVRGAYYLNLSKSDGEPSLLAMSRALHVLSSCILCLAPLAVDVLEALGRCVRTQRCVRDGLAASVCVCLTSAASVELLPRGWRAVAFPRWLHVLSCSTWHSGIVRCCIGGLCFGFIGDNTVSSTELRPRVVLPSRRPCLCCRASRYSCCATLIMIWLV